MPALIDSRNLLCKLKEVKGKRPEIYELFCPKAEYCISRIDGKVSEDYEKAVTEGENVEYAKELWDQIKANRQRLIDLMKEDA